MGGISAHPTNIIAVTKFVIGKNQARIPPCEGGKLTACKIIFWKWRAVKAFLRPKMVCGTL
jgi:hypothetical protein